MMKHFKILIKPVCTDLIFLITNCVECYDICYNKSRDMTDLTKNHLQKKMDLNAMNSIPSYLLILKISVKETQVNEH